MQRPVQGIAVVLVMSFFTCLAFAAEPNQPVDKRLERIRQPIMRMEANDMNRSAAEQLREQARERMRQRMMQGVLQRQGRGEGNVPEINAAMREQFEARRRQRMTPENTAARAQERMSMMTEVSNQVEASHREKIAKLNRIRELAQQQGDTETVAKTDNLIKEENQQYDARIQRLEQRKSRLGDANRMPPVRDINRPARPARQPRREVNQPPAK